MKSHIGLETTLYEIRCIPLVVIDLMITHIGKVKEKKIVIRHFAIAVTLDLPHKIERTILYCIVFSAKGVCENFNTIGYREVVKNSSARFVPDN